MLEDGLIGKDPLNDLVERQLRYQPYELNRSNLIQNVRDYFLSLSIKYQGVINSVNRLALSIVN